MFEAVQVAEDIYWVGAVDWTERSFHGYTTDRGSTYNAYLVMDGKPTLIDTVKAPFAPEMIERISQVVDPSAIEYIVSNHVEQDHSGGIPAVMALAPNARIVTSDPHGAAGLRAHYGDGYAYQPVKSGDTLAIGKRTLTFVHTMMVHWPDNMVTYDGDDRILFSNDAFGQHLATDCRFDDQVCIDDVYAQARKYYANIVMPYSRHVGKALDALAPLPIDVIAPAHGVIWRSRIPQLLDRYARWSSLRADESAVVVYDSMWHATESMARAIVDSFVRLGIPCRLFDLKVDHISDIVPEVMESRYLAVGSPTLNNGMLPTVSGFCTYLKGLSPRGGWAGRAAISFGSYGWAPSGPSEVAEMLGKAGFTMPLGMISHQWAADGAYLSELTGQVAEGIAAFRDGSPHEEH